MDRLLAHLNGMSVTGQADFASRCGTSVAYIRKTISAGNRFGEKLCINFERESLGAIVCEELRPDVDWAYLRNTSKAA